MSKTERRRKSRKRPISLVYVELASANGGMMRDLSEEGFAVRAMLPLRAGEKTPFTFSLSETIRIEGEGDILWVAENGRVAGVRFTHVSPSARGQIQEWLLHPKTPPNRDKVIEKAKPASSPTLEELREEIHTVPPRPEKPTPSEAPLPAPPVEVVAKPSEPVPIVKTPESPAPEIRPHELAPAETTVLQPAEASLQLPPAPDLPRLTLTPKGEDALFHHSPAVPGHSREAPIVPDTPSPSLAPTMPDSEMESKEAHPNLPEISSILIQPSGRPLRGSPQAPSAEPVSSWDTQNVPGESWTERVSLSNAIAAMVVLTFMAGLYVFHRNVGQGLIWLGEALGGARQTQTQMAPNFDTGAANTPAGPSSEQRNSSLTQLPSTTGAASGHDNASGAAPIVGNPAASLGTTARNPLPPVAPLSGMASSQGTGSETGQAEYLEAMQILQGKPATADNSEALRLLWMSVEKGNSSAELALAEMYWHGHGVPRNCEQTRILLTAAARKGSAEAQKRLEQFQREGCE